MNTPIVMLLNVVLWSFGVSAAILAGLIWLDRIAARKQDETAVSGPRLDAQALIGRVQQPSAPRRRSAASQPAARAA
jgi:cytochrome c-type biogenesis protein CcmH/NrfF